jgi:hypothetical protein
LPDQLWEDLRTEITRPTKKVTPLQLEPKDRSKLRNPFSDGNKV